MSYKQLAVNVLVVMMATSVFTNPVRFSGQWENKKSQATNRQKVQTQKSFSFSTGNQAASYSAKKTQVSSMNKKSESVPISQFSATAHGRSQAQFVGNKPHAARQISVSQGNGFKTKEHATNDINNNIFSGAQLNVGSVPTLQEFRHTANTVLVKKRLNMQKKAIKRPNDVFSLTRALKLKKSHKTKQKTNNMHDVYSMFNHKPKTKSTKIKIKFVKEKVRKSDINTRNTYNRDPTFSNTTSKVKWTSIHRADSNEASIKNENVSMEQNRKSLGSRRYYIPFTGSQNVDNRNYVDKSPQDLSIKSNDRWFTYKSNDIYDHKDFAKRRKPQISVKTTESIPTVHPRLLDNSFLESTHNRGVQKLPSVKQKQIHIKSRIQKTHSQNSNHGVDTLRSRIPPPNPLIMSEAQSSLPTAAKLRSPIRPSIALPDLKTSNIYTKRNHYKQVNSPIAATRQSILNTPKSNSNDSHSNSNKTKITNNNTGKGKSVAKHRRKIAFSMKRKSSVDNRQKNTNKIKSGIKNLNLNIRKNPPLSLSQTNKPLLKVNEITLAESVIPLTVHKSTLSNSHTRTSSSKPASATLKSSRKDSHKFPKTVTPTRKKNIVKTAITLNNAKPSEKVKTVNDSTKMMHNSVKANPQKQKLNFTRLEYSVINTDLKSKHNKPSNMESLTGNVNTDNAVPKVFSDISFKSNFVNNVSPDNVTPSDQQTEELAPVALARHSKRKKSRNGKSKRKKNKRKRFRKKPKNDKTKMHTKINAADIIYKNNKTLSLHIVRGDKDKGVSKTKSEKIPKLSEHHASVTQITSSIHTVVAIDKTKEKKNFVTKPLSMINNITTEVPKPVTKTNSKASLSINIPKHIGHSNKTSMLNSFKRIPTLLQQNQSSNKTVTSVKSLGKLPNERFIEHKKFMKEINRPNLTFKSESKHSTGKTENAFVKGFASSGGGDDISVNNSNIKGKKLANNTLHISSSDNIVNIEKDTNSKSMLSSRKKVVIGISTNRGKGLPTSRKPSGRRSFQQNLRAMASRATANPPMGSASARAANAKASSKWANRMIAGAGIVSQAGSSSATGQVLPINTVISNAEHPANAPANNNVANNNLAAGAADATGSATTGNSGSWVTYTDTTHSGLAGNSGTVNPTRPESRLYNSGTSGSRGSTGSGIVSQRSGSSGATIISESVKANSKTPQVHTETTAGAYAMGTNHAPKYASFPSKTSGLNAAASSSSLLSGSTRSVTSGSRMKTAGGAFMARVTKPASVLVMSATRMRGGTVANSNSLANSKLMGASKSGTNVITRVAGIGSGASGLSGNAPASSMMAANPSSAIVSRSRSQSNNFGVAKSMGVQMSNSGFSAGANAAGTSLGAIGSSENAAVNSRMTANTNSAAISSKSRSQNNKNGVAKSMGVSKSNSGFSVGTNAVGTNSGASGSSENVAVSSMMAANTGSPAVGSTLRSQNNRIAVGQSMGVSKSNSRIGAGANAIVTGFGASGSSENAAASSRIASNTGNAAIGSRLPSQSKNFGVAKSVGVQMSNSGIGAGKHAAATSFGTSGSNGNTAGSSRTGANTGSATIVSKSRSQSNNFGVSKSVEVSKSNSRFSAGTNAALASFGASGSSKNIAASSMMPINTGNAAIGTKSPSQSNKLGVAKSVTVSKSNSGIGADANAAGTSFGASDLNENAAARSSMTSGAKSPSTLSKSKSRGASSPIIKGHNSAVFSAASSTTKVQSGPFRQSPTGKPRIISANTRMSATKLTAPSSFSMRQGVASARGSQLAQAQATASWSATNNADKRANNVNTGSRSSGTSSNSGKVSQSLSGNVQSRTTNTVVKTAKSSPGSQGRKTVPSAKTSTLVNGSQLPVSSSTKQQNNLASASTPVSQKAPSTASKVKQTSSRGTKETEKEKIDKEMIAKVDAAHASVNKPARANSNEASSQPSRKGGYYYLDAYGNYKYYDGPAIQQPLQKHYDYYYNTPSPPVYSAGDYNYGSAWDLGSYPVYDYPIKQEKKKEEEES